MNGNLESSAFIVMAWFLIDKERILTRGEEQDG